MKKPFNLVSIVKFAMAWKLCSIAIEHTVLDPWWNKKTVEGKMAVYLSWKDDGGAQP